MAAWPVDLWNEWAIPILVLLSFALQVVLLVLAGIRRRGASSVPRVLLWLAYQLADSTAIYVLGLFSVISTETRDHELVVFWVPFLLLHLGGPDNITAFSLEDNQLWKRHLLTIVVQVVGAAYVLYRLVPTSGSLVLMVATMLVFAVSVVKYVERIWALKCGNLDDIRSSLNNSQVKDDSKINPEGIRGMYEDQELLEVAHSQFHFCKLKLVDSSVTMKPTRLQVQEYNFDSAKTWKLMAMELSLLYDILYTKATVTHTCTGYMIRFAAPPAIAAALALFQLHLMMTSGGTDGHNHRRVDVAITYALLAGTFFMEVTALLGAIGSTWTLAFLSGLPPRSSIRHALVCSGRWHQLRRVLLPLSRLDIRRRSWSGTIGQYNLLHLCTRDSDGHVVGRLAAMLGLEEWWKKFHYSGSFDVPDDLKKLLYDRYKEQMLNSENVNGLGLLRRNFGDLALEKHKVSRLIRRSVGGNELQEDIVMWHIATDIYLAKRVVVRDGDHTKVGYIEVLSNYMMFLLVNHPDLLPGLVLHRMYDISRANLVKIWSHPDHKNSRVPARAGSVLEKLFRLHDEPVLFTSMTKDSQKNQLAEILDELLRKKIAKEEEPHNSDQKKNDATSHESRMSNNTARKSNVDDFFCDSLYRVEYGARIAYKLLTKDDEEKALPSSTSSSTSLDVILDVWLDFLFYVANKCSRESYAKKLSSGAELTAILWLMGAHFQPYTPPEDDTITTTNAAGNPEDDTITTKNQQVPSLSA